MHTSHWKASLGVAALSLVGCASPTVERTAQALPEGGQRVTIELTSFAFAPSAVSVRAGAPVTIEAVSKSGIAHNLTLLSLDQGATLTSVDVPAKQNVTFQATPAPARAIRLLLRQVPASPLRHGGRAGGAINRRRPNASVVTR